MTNREARALLLSCEYTQRERQSSIARDLLTDPHWTRWEGVPDLDARATRLVLHVARPSYAAQVTVWCAVACLVLMLVGWVAKALGWM